MSGYICKYMNQVIHAKRIQICKTNLVYILYNYQLCHQFYFEKIASKKYLELYIIPIPTHARAQGITNNYYGIHFPMVISILIILYV